MKKSNIGIGNINYRIKTFLSKGVSEEEILDVIGDVEGFNPAYFKGGKIISDAQAKKAGLTIIDPKILQGISEALPTWQQIKKESDYDEIEDILADFFAQETIGDVLGEFRSQYYDLMNKIAAQYGFTGDSSTRIARAESLVRDIGSKEVIDRAKVWGEKYHDKKNNPFNYREAITELKSISSLFNNIPGTIAEKLGKTKGVRT